MTDRWDNTAPGEDDPLALLVYRSRLIGADPALVVWGGGNTSVKTREIDFLGRERAVLRIKGSGTDLKSIDAGGFPGIFLDDVLSLRHRDEMTDEEMVAYLEHCLVDPRGRRPSIETLLHGFLPAKHIDHTHADAIITLTNTERGREAVREALGDRVACVPWRRPGFALSKQVAELADAEAVVLANHGLVTWGETAKESYRTTIDLVRRAEVWLENHQTRPQPRSLPRPHSLSELLLKIRGRLGHRILQVNGGPDFVRLANRQDIDQLAAAGPATADHVLRIRPWACVLRDDDPVAAIDDYERRYRDFFSAHSWEGLAMLDALPKVFLVPGLGMVTAGRDLRDARITAEVASHTLHIAATGQDVHGAYVSLSERDLFDVEYWPLELYKLTLAPPPRELEGRIVVVTGAASGIGRAVARHLAKLGAQTVLFDRDLAGMEQTSEAITLDAGAEPYIAELDLTSTEGVDAAILDTITTFGGVDALVSNAGIAAACKLTDITPDFWRNSLEVNTTSHFLMTRAVMKAMSTQGIGGSLVYIASKNAFGPGAGFGAYSAAKAAQVQLARIAALEGGADGIRANVVNPDAVFGDSKLWSDDVRRERAAAHGIPVEDLGKFYVDRNLLHVTVTGHDVAEAVAFLISDRSKATTGTVITVDGGVAAAFPR